MKLAKLAIENFRHLERAELDFLDWANRVRELTVFFGRSACGKTTALDAIAAALEPALGLPCTRPSLLLSPRGIVRQGANHARVSCHLRFTKEEITTAREVARLAEQPAEVPDAREVTLTWQYPDERHEAGAVTCDPDSAWPLFRCRATIARMVATGRVPRAPFRHAGGVITFEQQRTGFGKSVPRPYQDIYNGIPNGIAKGCKRLPLADPEAILLSLAVGSHLPKRGGAEDDFTLIKNAYDRVCDPHVLLGATRDSAGNLELRFSNGKYEYTYEGLSSGEQMVLLFLIRLVTENVHNSLVLIDLPELHLYPIWERRLSYVLPRIGFNNQMIVATLSDDVRYLAPYESALDLGVLDNSPVLEASLP